MDIVKKPWFSLDRVASAGEAAKAFVVAGIISAYPRLRDAASATAMNKSLLGLLSRNGAKLIKWRYPGEEFSAPFGIGPNAPNDLLDARHRRALSAYIGLVPKQNSSGGKERLGSISKRGDKYLRWLLVAGFLAVIRYAQRHGTKRPWLEVARTKNVEDRSGSSCQQNRPNGLGAYDQT